MLTFDSLNLDKEIETKLRRQQFTQETLTMIKQRPYLISKRGTKEAMVRELFRGETRKIALTIQDLSNIYALPRYCKSCKGRVLDFDVQNNQTSIQPMKISLSCKKCDRVALLNMESKTIGGTGPFAKIKVADVNVMLARLCFSAYGSAINQVFAATGLGILPTLDSEIQNVCCAVLQSMYDEQMQVFIEFENSFDMGSKLLTDVQWSHPQRKGKRAPNAVASGSVPFPYFSELMKTNFTCSFIQ
jgi:hypothetical protein